MTARWITSQAAVVFGVFAVLSLSACQKKEAAPEPARPVRTMLVQAQSSASGAISYAGDVQARHESSLSFRVPGKLTLRSINVGDAVKPGQVLAQLDPRDLQLSRAAQEAQWAAANASFEQAKADLARFKQLLDQKFISPAEFERRQTAFDVARAQQQQARAQLDVGSNQAGYAVLKADKAGVVTAVLAEAGQVVGAGQTVLRVADPREKEVVISIPESRLREFRKAKNLTVSLWANPGLTYPAHIREIAPLADAVTRTYSARIGIDAQDENIQLGMTANVSTAGENASLLQIPLSALYQTGKQATVWVVDDKTLSVQQRVVTVAHFEGNGVALSSGLRSGERIVTAGVTRLINGQKVRLLEDAAP